MVMSNEILILDRGGLERSTHSRRDIPATLKSLINATRNLAAFCTTTDAYLASTAGPQANRHFCPVCACYVDPYVGMCMKTSRELKLG